MSAGIYFINLPKPKFARLLAFSAAKYGYARCVNS